MRRTSHRRIPRRADLWPRFWRRRPVATVVLVLLAALVAVSCLRGMSGSDHERYHNRIFHCVRVVDGDTIDIDTLDGKRATTRIRLWGVDTPETAKSARGEMYFGPEASAFTKSFVEQADVKIILALDETRDKYGRLLAYVYFDDPPRMLNEEIIHQGYGYADTRFDHVWAGRFRDLEAKARKEGVGLWANIQPEQMPEWRQRYEAWKAGETSTSAR